MTFDYGEADTDPAVVSAVSDEIRTVLKPALSDEDRARFDLERAFRLEQNREWHEERRLERERAQAEAAEAAQREAALVTAQAREKANRESRERRAQEARAAELSQLQLKAAQHEAWQRNVDRAANNVLHQQRTRAVLADLDAMINPPPPPPEPEPQVVYVPEDEWGSPHFGPDFNVKLFARRFTHPWG